MSGEEDQHDRENYSLIIINLLDTDLEDNSKITALIYLNGELDDTIKIKGSTTIFIHNQDMLTFEIKDQSPPQTIGVIEISTLQLLSESERIFQKWLPSVYNQRMHKILFEFEIQKMGNLNSSKVLRNQGQSNEAEAGSNKRSSQGAQSQLSSSDKYLPCIQSTQLNNGVQFVNKPDEVKQHILSSAQNDQNAQRKLDAEYEKYLDNELNQNKANRVVGIDDQQQQRIQIEKQQRMQQQQQQPQQNDNFTVSPIKVIEESELKRTGYAFQKLGQSNLLQISDPLTVQLNGSGEINQQLQGQLQNLISPSGPSQAIFTTDSSQIYEALEEELVKLTKKIQNKNFNSLIEKRRAQYLELKNLLKDISEQFEMLKKHPCRSCEKKYIPSIQKGIQKLYQGYKQLMDQIAQQQLNQSQQQQQLQQQQKQQLPIQEFIQSLSSSTKKGVAQPTTVKSNTQRSKSPIISRNLQASQNLQSSVGSKPGKSTLQASNVVNQQSTKQQNPYQMSPNNQKKIDKLKEEEQKAHDLQMNSNYIRDQLEAQFRRTHDLETENKQLKLRNFILEGDLKNLLKRIQQEKLTFSNRATFKLQEFRQIFEYFHSLRLERENLLDEIHQLSEELNINQSGGDKRKNHQNGAIPRQGSNGLSQKSMKQTMNEYMKSKQDTMSAVQQEEYRVESDLVEGRNSHFLSSPSQQYSYLPHFSQSLSPKPRDGGYGQDQTQYAKDKSNLSMKYEKDLLQGTYPLNDEMKIVKGSQSSFPYNGDNNGYSQLSHNRLEQSSPSHFVAANYDSRPKDNSAPSSASARNEIHHLLNQRKNVINELLEKIGEI